MRAMFGSVLACLLVAAHAAATEPVPPLEVAPGERLLVIAPHPDDETLGAGALIQRVRASGGEVRAVLITAGDGFVEAVVHETGSLRPRPSAYVAYGQHRLREARAAFRVLAPDHSRLQVLGFPDGGLAELLHAHWWRTRPERSPFTAASDPPYDDDALEPDVPYDGDDLRRELARIIQHARPTMIALPDPLDRHPDHRAAALFTLLALKDWSANNPKLPLPVLLAYLVHWPDWPPGWDAAEARAQPDEPLELPPAAAHDGGRRVALVVTDQELTAKLAALRKHKTQIDVMGPFLTAFVRRTEPFTILAPAEIAQVAAAIEHGVMPAPHPHPAPRHTHAPARR
jgi:LmbE family N-acetylglucosaminyl deacetylase